MTWMGLSGPGAVQANGLIADDAGRAIRRCRIEAVGGQVCLGASDEEGAGLTQGVQPAEIDVGPIHDIDGPGLRDEQIESVDVVQLAVRNVDEAWDVAPQVEQGVHLHRRLGRAEMRPWKHR